MSEEFFGIKYVYRLCSETRLINPKLVRFFVHHKSQFFTMGSSLAPRSSIQTFSDREAKDMQLTLYLMSSASSAHSFNSPSLITRHNKQSFDFPSGGVASTFLIIKNKTCKKMAIHTKALNDKTL